MLPLRRNSILLVNFNIEIAAGGFLSRKFYPLWRQQAPIGKGLDDFWPILPQLQHALRENWMVGGQ
jgi:hypothetical protein